MLFSQNNEQTIILNYFSDFKERRFLDIGSNDGKTLSNTHALALAGWSGVCVEPDPIPFEKLNLLYKENPAIECYNVAIGKETGTMPFYQSDSHLSKQDSGLLSTLDKNEIGRWKGTQKFTEIEVPVLTWVDFVMQLPDIETGFDFISIDAEGMDIAILQQINLTGMDCQLLCIEWNAITANRKIITDYCAKHGMKLHDQNFENLIYARS